MFSVKLLLAEPLNCDPLPAYLRPSRPDSSGRVALRLRVELHTSRGSEKPQSFEALYVAAAGPVTAPKEQERRGEADDDASPLSNPANCASIAATQLNTGIVFHVDP